MRECIGSVAYGSQLFFILAILAWVCPAAFAQDVPPAVLKQHAALRAKSRESTAPSTERPADFSAPVAVLKSSQSLRSWWAQVAERLDPHFEHVSGIVFTTSPSPP